MSPVSATTVDSWRSCSSWFGITLLPQKTDSIVSSWRVDLRGRRLHCLSHSRPGFVSNREQEDADTARGPNPPLHGCAVHSGKKLGQRGGMGGGARQFTTRPSAGADPKPTNDLGKVAHREHGTTSPGELRWSLASNRDPHGRHRTAHRTA